MPRKPVDPTETKQDRFKRLGQQRITRVLNSLRLVGNLSTANYAFTAEDVNTMREAVLGQVDKTFQMFEKRIRERIAFDFNLGRIATPMPRDEHRVTKVIQAPPEPIHAPRGQRRRVRA